MSAPGTPTPPERPRREAADPLQMSLAEKLACEREARHDVAARGRVADVSPVQQYLTHERCEDHRHLPTGAPRRTAPVPPSPGRRAGNVPVGLRGWLRWGEDGRPGSVVIPRC
jgi:hypothetical protein